MKHALILLPVMLLSLTTMTSCRKKGPAERIGEKIDDATNSRPAEGIRDAVEDLTKK